LFLNIACHCLLMAVRPTLCSALKKRFHFICETVDFVSQQRIQALFAIACRWQCDSLYARPYLGNMKNIDLLSFDLQMTIILLISLPHILNNFT
jgi:hypothetical protein